jgi:hypothetical protein
MLPIRNAAHLRNDAEFDLGCSPGMRPIPPSCSLESLIVLLFELPSL